GRFEVIEIVIVGEAREHVSRLEKPRNIHLRGDFKHPGVYILRIGEIIKETVAMIFKILSICFAQFYECVFTCRTNLLKQSHKLVEVFFQTEPNPQWRGKFPARRVEPCGSQREDRRNISATHICPKL